MTNRNLRMRPLETATNAPDPFLELGDNPDTQISQVAPCTTSNGLTARQTAINHELLDMDTPKDRLGKLTALKTAQKRPEIVESAERFGDFLDVCQKKNIKFN